MCKPDGLNVASGVFGAMSSINQGNAQADQYNYQAQQADQQATNIQNVGVVKQQELAATQRKYVGAQQAAMGASGILGSSVTAEDIISDTAAQSSIDRQTLQWQTDAQVADQRQQARLMRTAASNAEQSGYMGAVGSLIGSATKMANSQNQWDTVGGKPTTNTNYPNWNKYNTANYDVSISSPSWGQTKYRW
jgi:hypothetical protein